MRKTIALLVVASVALALPVFAATRTGKATLHTVSGQLTKWDDATKTFAIKTKSGKGMAFAWDDKTQLVGTATVGEEATIHYQMVGGKHLAEKVEIHAKKT